MILIKSEIIPYYILHFTQKPYFINEKKIILIDDKKSIGKIVATYLNKEYNFAYFESPIKVIQNLEQGEIPDLIISDIRMPEMMGDDFLRYLKNNKAYQSIPIIILSSEENTSKRIRLLEEGAADYILKPFNPLELKIRVKKVIG